MTGQTPPLRHHSRLIGRRVKSANVLTRTEKQLGIVPDRDEFSSTSEHLWLTWSTAAINGGALAQMAYGFSEFYVDGIGGKLAASATLTEDPAEPITTPSASSSGTPASDATEAYRNFVSGFVGLRTELAKAVIEDLSVASRVTTIEAYAAGFGKPADSLPGDSAFQNFAFAEMLDAWYCAKNSRADLATAGLTRASKAFAPFAEYLGKAWWE